MSFPAPPADDPQDVVNELSNELMSPYCPGRTISACTSQGARQIESYILEEAEAGKSEAEIREELYERFGAEKLGSTHDPVLVWGSVGVGLLAAVAIGFAARRWVAKRKAASARPSDDAPPPSTASDEEMRKLDAELQALDQFS